jgi:uncharacterized membrane protein YeaQ/YmgE (transglycosylase-associated protein family)
MNFVKKYKLTIIGIIVGAIVGYLYYHFVGCSSGTCAITSKPINSTLYGALLGGLLLNTLKKDKEKSKTEIK